MDFGFVSIALLVLSAVLVLLGLKILFKRHWFLPFLRGFSGFSLLILALLSVLVSLNVATYSQLNAGQTLANISFSQKNRQEFEVTVVNVADGAQSTYTLYGDTWQADARILQITGSHFYQLDRLSSRYYSLEQEGSGQNSAHKLQHNKAGIDLWALFNGKSIGLISADYSKASFSPMADGAVYTLDAGAGGLQVKPVNEAAKRIVNEWL